MIRHTKQRDFLPLKTTTMYCNIFGDLNNEVKYIKLGIDREIVSEEQQVKARGKLTGE